MYTCIRLNCNLVNFKIPNGFLYYYGNDFGISKLTRLHFKRVYVCTYILYSSEICATMGVKCRLDVYMGTTMVSELPIFLRKFQENINYVTYKVKSRGAQTYLIPILLE